MNIQETALKLASGENIDRKDMPDLLAVYRAVRDIESNCKKVARQLRQAMDKKNIGSV